MDNFIMIAILKYDYWIAITIVNNRTSVVFTNQPNSLQHFQSLQI